MTVYVLDSDAVLTGAHVTMAAAGGDDVIITPGTDLVTTSGASVIDRAFAANVLANHIHNYGSLTSIGFTVELPGVGSTITNSVRGQITSLENAALYIDGDEVTVSNHGEVTGAIGVYLYTSLDSTVNNTGTITGTGTGAFSAAITSYVFGNDIQSQLINNSGTLVGATRSQANGGEQWAYEQTVFDGSDDFSDVTFHNSGTVLGKIATEDGADTITNSGSITGDLELFLGADRVENYGLLVGDIEAGDDGDTVQNGGTITGLVDLGDGADSYAGVSGGVVVGAVLGGMGDDTLKGGEADDVLDGGADDDTLRGNNGQDTLNGGDDADNINGGADDDILSGDAGNDTLRGDGGDDEIDGGTEDDRIFGGAGDDQITGGTGKDVMRGNGGADTFIFETDLDSLTTAADRIRDFELGIDQIDVSGITGFTFIGDTGFSGTQAEIKYTDTGGAIRLEMDADGDGTADMRVNMNGLSSISETDFIL